MNPCTNCIARPGSKWAAACKLKTKCKETPPHLREPRKGTK